MTLTLLGAGPTSAGDPGDPIVTEGLVLHLDAGKSASYPGTGTTWYDLTDNGNDATFHNGVTFDASKAGGAVVLDGSDDNASIPGNGTLSNGDTYTWEIWFWIENGGWANNILLYYGNALVWLSCAGRPPSDHCRQYINVGGSFSGTWLQFHTGKDAYPLPPGPWLHVAYTYDSGTGYATQYMDGVNTGTQYWGLGTNTMFNAFTNLLIGSTKTSGSQVFSGDISIIRAYDKTLSDEQIAQNYEAQKSRFYH